MNYGHSNDAAMKKRFPEEASKECLFDMQMNILDYLENRKRELEPENGFYAPRFEGRGVLGVNLTYTNMRQVCAMMIYNEKNASHCMTVVSSLTQVPQPREKDRRGDFSGDNRPAECELLPEP